MIYLLYLISASLIWSSTPIFVKISMLYDVNPLNIAFFRLFFGGIFLIIITRRFIINRELITLSIFGLGLNFLTYHGGLYFTTSSAAQFLESLSIIFVIIFLKYMNIKIKRHEYFATILAFFGIFLIFHSHKALRELLIGDFLEIIAAISWAYFIVKSKFLLKNLGELYLLSNLYIISSVMLLPSIFIFEINFETILFSILMTIIHTIIAYNLYYKGIKHSSPIAAAISFNLSPVFTLIMSKILLKEFINFEFLLGCILIIISLFISGRKYENKSFKN